MHAAAWHFKRLLETTAAVVILVLLVPVCLAFALAIRLSSPGPVLFRQRRIGRGGQPFEMLKFRSMHVNGDSDTTWSVENDRRITAVGRFLRRTNLDELPQLVNVVRGEMALVGPRPERPFFVDRFEAKVPSYAARHRVRPGITGWAQVHDLRGDSSIPERVRFDNDYIDGWSLGLDALILCRTVCNMVGDVLPGDFLRRPGQVAARRRSRLHAMARPTRNGHPPTPIALDPARVLPPAATDGGAPTEPSSV